MAKTKTKKVPRSRPKETETVTVAELDERHLSQCLARVGDPMTRYLLCMLIDRLTQQISAFERPESKGDASLN